MRNGAAVKLLVHLCQLLDARPGTEGPNQGLGSRQAEQSASAGTTQQSAPMRGDASRSFASFAPPAGRAGFIFYCGLCFGGGQIAADHRLPHQRRWRGQRHGTCSGGSCPKSCGSRVVEGQLAVEAGVGPAGGSRPLRSCTDTHMPHLHNRTTASEALISALRDQRTARRQQRRRQGRPQRRRYHATRLAVRMGQRHLEGGGEVGWGGIKRSGTVRNGQGRSGLSAGLSPRCLMSLPLHSEIPTMAE